jgi:preprotein translocase subunit YajC
MGGILNSPLLFLAAMLLLMWALLIRPQQKREKELRAMLSKVEKGDAIVTSGGLHGKVTGVAEDVLTVELAPNVRVKMSRSAVASRTPAKNEGEKS